MSKVFNEISFGIIPLQFVEGEWQVLLVQLHAGHWSFPKGHAEANETCKQTAERELLEETGLKVKSYLRDEMLEENYFFRKPNQLIKKYVGYYPALVSGKVTIQEAEIKNFVWIGLNEAESYLTFKESKKILQSLRLFL